MKEKINKNYTLDVEINHLEKNKNYKMDVDFNNLTANSKNTYNQALEFYNLGVDYLYNKWDKKSSLIYLSKSKQICDNLIQNKTEKLDVYLVLADILSIVGDYKEAIKVYDLGLTVPSKNDFLYKEKKLELKDKKSEALKKIS